MGTCRTRTYDLRVSIRDALYHPTELIVTLTVNTNQTTPSKSIESFRLESGQYSNLAPKIRQKFFFNIVTLTVNTNLTTPLKPKSIKPIRLQSVPNNYTYIHIYILSKNITLLLAQSGKKKKGRGFDHFDPRLLSIKLGVELSLNGLEFSPLSHCI
ncbi:hypothetical protein SFRURICE_014420 [Spodoptera frugiperda]|nr:hypothetical protein SFRURICE_014420 [Spodoptera frugiperda]